MTIAKRTWSPAWALIRSLVIGVFARPFELIVPLKAVPEPGALNVTPAGATAADVNVAPRSLLLTTPFVTFSTGSVSLTCTMELAVELSLTTVPVTPLSSTDCSNSWAWLVRNRPSAKGLSLAVTVNNRSMVDGRWARS